ncbi:hypothetical protein QJQ45_005088 [Haematococcus lacustris]|nr:hypothetical protein QJQ45_005088 [Haematococcus lacustris]
MQRSKCELSLLAANPAGRPTTCVREKFATRAASGDYLCSYLCSLLLDTDLICKLDTDLICKLDTDQARHRSAARHRSHLQADYLCLLLLDTDLICKLMVVAVVGQQLVMPDLGWVATEGGMHAFEVARHVEQLLDNLLDASTQDTEERFPYIFKHAQGLFVATAPYAHTAAGSLLTSAASAPNPMALEGPQQWAAAKPKLVVLHQALYEYLYEHSQLFFQLPHLLAAMGSSNALYAQKAAEQVLKQRDTRLQQWDVHQRQKQQQQQGGRRQAPSGQAPSMGCCHRALLCCHGRVAKGQETRPSYGVYRSCPAMGC